MKSFLFAVATFAILIGCQKDEETNPKIENPDAIKYKVTFTFNWSKQNYPENYPSNAHFSPLVGWSHISSNFFAVGTTASQGIKNMAETGAVATLDAEISTRIANKEGFKLIKGNGLPSGTGNITVEVLVNKENSYVTLATMIAPSPDWYVAVVGVNLLQGGAFVAEKTVEAFAYDAGTDSGVDYTSTNEITNPRGKISKITTPPLNGNGAIATAKFVKL